MKSNDMKGTIFRDGTDRAKVYDLVVLQGKSIDEASKILKWKESQVRLTLKFVEDKLSRVSAKANPTVSVIPSVAPEDVIESSDKDVVDMNKFIPTEDGYIPRKIGKSTDMKVLEKLLKARHPVLLTGPTGAGKTHAIRNFCYKNKIPYIPVSMNGGTTADELIGHWVPKKEGGFRWQDGILTMFARNGGVVCLEEVNGCPAEILFSIHSLTDKNRCLILTSKDGEIVKASPDFFLTATMNPEYEGTRPLNAAFKDRFRIIPYGYDDKIEEELIKDKDLLTLANKLRLMITKGELTTPVSTRKLLFYKEDEITFGKSMADEFFLNSFEPYEKEAIKNVMEMMSKSPSTVMETKI